MPMKQNKVNNRTLLKFALFIIFIFALIVFAVKYVPSLSEYAKNPIQTREYLLSFKGWGFVVYVLIQAVHVLLIVIPGDIFDVCGGYVFGVPKGTLLSMIGIMLGTVAAFYISRMLGYSFISRFIPAEKISKIGDILNSTKGTKGMLILCLMPLIPKDLMMYIAGLTPVKAPRLFFVYAISRVPGTLIWVTVGAQAYEKNVQGLVLTFSALAFIIMMGIILQRMLKNKGIERIK